MGTIRVAPDLACIKEVVGQRVKYVVPANLWGIQAFQPERACLRVALVFDREPISFGFFLATLAICQAELKSKDNSFLV